MLTLNQWYKQYFGRTTSWSTQNMLPANKNPHNIDFHLLPNEVAIVIADEDRYFEKRWSLDEIRTIHERYDEQFRRENPTRKSKAEGFGIHIDEDGHTWGYAQTNARM